MASAAAIARLENRSVEVVGERTEFSSTWLLPDGTIRKAMSSGQVWVPTGRGDGSAVEDWQPVDLRLRKLADGSLVPTSAPLDIRLSGGSTAPGWVDLAAFSDGVGRLHRLQWKGALPEPRIEGGRAVYPRVTAGVDLVVDVSRAGVQYNFVLLEGPATRDKATEVRALLRGLKVRISVDGAVAKRRGGQVVFFDGSREVSAVGQPEVWDSEADTVREHPVSSPGRRCPVKSQLGRCRGCLPGLSMMMESI